MNALPTPLAAPIVAALNHLIEQEPWACSLLTPFAGRVIRFDASAFALSLKVTEQGGIDQAPEAEAAAVTLIVPLQQWPLVVADVAEGGQAAAMRHVRIDGDAELANVVSTLAQPALGCGRGSVPRAAWRDGRAGQRQRGAARGRRRASGARKRHASRPRLARQRHRIPAG
jgi:ubiquinone biosynthesis protein UbiJ